MDNLEKQSAGYQTSKKERVSYAVYFFGQLTVFVIVTSYLQIFLTDIAIPATAVATVFLIAKVWDAINDPIFGIIVNKVKFKKDKYKPWLKVSAYLIPVFTIALFAIPTSLPLAVKIAFAGVLYVLWDLSYTLCDIPVFSVVTTMTTNIRERNNIISYGRVLMFVGSLGAGILIPMLYPTIGWLPAVAIMSVISLITMVPLGHVARERHAPAPEAESPSIRELLLAVAKNKYLLLLVVSFIIGNISNTSLAVGGYFAIYCLGGPQIMSLTALLGIIPSILLAGLIPSLTKKIDKYYLYMTSIGGVVVFSILMAVVGYSNLGAYLTIFTLRSVCSNLTGILLPMFIVDCTEYGQFKTGENSVAVSVSLQTFASKVYTALASAIGMYVLGIVGFVSGTDAVQPPQALEALWVLNSIVPAIGQVIAFLILLFGYRLRDKYIQCMARANYGEITREEALEQIPRQL